MVEASFCLPAMSGTDQMAEALLCAENLHWNAPLFVNTADWQVRSCLVDQSMLTPTAQAVLQGQATWLMRNADYLDRYRPKAMRMSKARANTTWPLAHAVRAT